MIVRAFFRALRTLDHQRDADLLFHVQHYASGQFAVVRVGRGVTLYDTDVPVPLTTIREYAQTIEQYYGWRDHHRATARTLVEACL